VISTMEIHDQERSNVPRCAEIAPEQRRLIGASSQIFRTSACRFRLGHVGSRGSDGTTPLHEAGDQEGGVCWTDRRNAWPYRR
jgi:hypothetical protein